MQIKGLIHKIVRKTGYDFLRYTSDNFSSLKRINIIASEKIDVVLDVGANRGNYVCELRDSGFSGRIISFEPLSTPFKIMEQKAAADLLWTCINSGCGSENYEAEINVSGHETSSSLLPISEVHTNAMPTATTVSKEKVRIRTLDSFLNGIILFEDRIFLKVDVQGYEMYVLQGAAQTFKQVRAVELELSFIPLYQGAPVFAEMMKFMDEHGFALVALKHVFSDPKSDQLLQADGIFRKIS